MDFWTRPQLKLQAKDVLKRSYWMTFAVCLVAGIISGLFSGSSSGISSASVNAPPAVVLALATVATCLGLVGLAFYIFVANPINVGMSKWLTLNRQQTPYANFSELFSSFKKESYIRIVGAMAWRDLFVFLWSLLFIIPGIIKYYQYYFIQWILADNPNIHYKRAMELSSHMTRGQKWRIFVLHLSFIGWGLLGVLACGIGILFVAPYIAATEAELYAAFRHQALQSGMCSYEELGFASPASAPAAENALPADTAPPADGVTGSAHYEEPQQ